MDKEADPTQLTYWQNYLFASTILLILPLSIIVMIPGIYMASLYNLKVLILVDFLAIFTTIFVAVTPQVPVFIRKLIFNGVLYITSVTLLIYLGSLGPGLLYLLGITIFIVLSLEKIYAYIAVGINFLICIFIGFLILTGNATPVIETAYSFESWIAVSLNLVFLSAAAVLLIPILFDGLRATLVLENQLRSDLEEEQRWLELLESAIENTSESIIIMESKKSEESDRNILYVNEAFEKMTGYSSDEIIGETLAVLIGPNTDNDEIENVMIAFAEKKTIQTEVITYRKNGDSFWTHVSLAPVQDSEEEFPHWICVMSDINERLEYMNRLKESLLEKETLLMEIHHRVKNNLAVVSSMMQLQAMEEEDESLQKKLYDSVVRIRTMVTIHELLYESGNFAKINFSRNLEKLVTMITDTILNEGIINVTYRCVDLELNVNQAIPVSLIVNEVVTNAIKHAFTGRKKGEIKLGVELQYDNQVLVKVEDDGRGFPSKFDGKKTSLGMQLISVLCDQINATYSYKNRLAGGTIFEMQFKKTVLKGIGNAHL